MTSRPRSKARADLSDEVLWYLDARGIEVPDCPPLIRTPEPDGPDFVFDPARVDLVLEACRHLRHTQGQWAGRPFVPDPWQVAFIIAPVFGWVRWDDDAAGYVRVITDLYVDVPRKNGKSSLAGAVACYMAFADNEPGAQVVTAATSERQAGFVFNPLKTLATKSPALKSQVKVTTKRIYQPRTDSHIEVVSSAADAQHGANIHASIIDELHVHKTPDLVEALETGTGSRRQPLTVIITTADTGRPDTIYARKRKRVEQLAAGAITDPTTYGVVWAVEPDADPFDEASWRAANPGYGISPTRAYLRRKATEAQQSPADLAKFLRLHLGIRTKQDTRYVTLPEWDRNAGMVRETELAGRAAYGGLDLGNVADLTALCWLFPADVGYDAVWRFWLPEAVVTDLDRRTAGGLSTWIRAGLVTVTPGATTDYDWVAEQAKRDLDSFDVKAVGFDPWNANQLTKRLDDDGAPLVEVRQGFASMSPPMKEIKRLLAAGTPDKPMLRHGGNPVMRWMTDNLAVAMDPAGNVKPDKARSAEKIDGWSALATAMSRAMHHKARRRSAYADADLMVI